VHVHALLFATRYMSSFRSAAGTSTLHLIVNRVDADRTGATVTLPCAAGTRVWDLYHGKELTEAVCEGGETTLSVDLEQLGVGAVLTVGSGAGAGVHPRAAFLTKMRAMTATPLDNFTTDRSFLPQKITPNPRTETPTPFPPEGMVRCPADM
jgi:iron(II)-dependent oxidoreductase